MLEARTNANQDAHTPHDDSHAPNGNANSRNGTTPQANGTAKTHNRQDTREPERRSEDRPAKPPRAPATFLGASSLRLRKHVSLLKKSDLFDAEYYLEKNSDLRAANVNPYLHYCRTGWKESRDPGPEFNTRLYLEANKDVRDGNVNPLVHYELHGREEGRLLKPDPTPQAPTQRIVRPPVRSAQSVRKLSAGIQTPPVRSGAMNGKSHGQAPMRASAPTPVPPQPNGATASPASTIDAIQKLLPGKAWDDETLAFGPVIGAGWERRIELLGIIDNGSPALRAELPSVARNRANSILSTAKLTVSVIMPTWNRVGVIDKAIESALAQRYLPTELIVVDDGSTDGTIDHLNATYPALVQNGFLKIVKGNHVGVSHARNLGLEASSGDLIAYLDSDNTWRPDFLLTMVAMFESCDELYTAYAGLAAFDSIQDRTFERASRYDRKRLLDGNFIDLNVFIHRRQLYLQMGGFDTNLKRLVDWDLIIRYTRLYEPAYVPIVGVDYYLGGDLNNITKTVPLEENRQRVLLKHAGERLRLGLEKLRLAYIVYDFPALSQTFVTNEVRWLVENGVDVVAYHMIDPDKSADLDFPIKKVRVESAEHLKECLVRDDRNLCHSHFVYPTITNFVWPACEEIGIPFTVFPHAVDLFHESNVKRNRIDELAKSDQCLKIFVYGDHHKDFLVSRGVPQNKIAYNFQVPGLAEEQKTGLRKIPTNASEKKRGIVIARFIEKKGISYLIEAIAKLSADDRAKLQIDIYGYGPEEQSYIDAIKAAALENTVKLCGPIVSPEALQSAYDSADFLCAPCVVAKNGDRDGFPTVILDAINEGIPVLTTAVSGIPDYLSDGVQAIVTEPQNVDACAEGLIRLMDMSPKQIAGMVHRARQFASAKVNLENTVKVYLDHWLNRPIDLFMVTYNTEKYEDSLSTIEIIRRVKEHTSTPYTLTIIDNDSDPDFKQKLLDAATDDPNIRLILKDDNLLCGPASNIAIRSGDAKYAVYICSKEGFVLQHGWERPLMHFMESNEDVAQAGHLCHLPRATYGREFDIIPEFPKFRNQSFARTNPNRPFKHVQGGCFIVRRDVFLEFGGFNEDVPQNNMDVEFSYMLESEGWRVAKIPDMISLSIKTLPNLGAQINERTPIVHPSNYHQCNDELDVWLSDRTQHRCNTCGWTGDHFTVDERKREICPNCHSDGLDRLVFAALASDHRAHRGERFAGLVRGTGLSQALGQRMFKQHALTDNADAFMDALQNQGQDIAVIIIDRDLVPAGPTFERGFWETVIPALKPGGKILVTNDEFGDHAMPLSLRKFFESDFDISAIDLASQLSAYDWRRLGEVVFRNY